MLKFVWIFFLNISIITIWYFLFKKKNILDKPWKDIKWQRKPVPTMMWIFIYISTILNVIVFFPEYIKYRIFLWFAVWWLLIIVIWILDELHYLWKSKLKISPVFRLISYIIISLLVIKIWWIYVNERILPNWNKLFIPKYIFSVFFIIWMIICVNSINRFDWINSQASWVSAIWFLTIFLLVKFVVFKKFDNISIEKKYILTFVENISLILTVVSTISTFLEFKPYALLRDIWVTFFWFSLAYLSVIWWIKIWTVLVVLSLVMFDAIRTWLYRLLILKRNPMKWDYNHLHHRLQKLWYSKTKIRIFIRSFSLIMMFIMLTQWINRISKIIIFSVSAFLFFSINTYIFLFKKKNILNNEEKVDF